MTVNANMTKVYSTQPSWFIARKKYSLFRVSWLNIYLVTCVRRPRSGFGILDTLSLQSPQWIKCISMSTAFQSQMWLLLNGTCLFRGFPFSCVITKTLRLSVEVSSWNQTRIWNLGFWGLGTVPGTETQTILVSEREIKKWSLELITAISGIISQK